MNAADVTESSNLGLMYIRLLTADKSAKGTMVCCNNINVIRRNMAYRERCTHATSGTICK